MKTFIWKWAMFVLAFSINQSIWIMYGRKAGILCWLVAVFFSAYSLIALYEEMKGKEKDHDKGN